MTPDPLLTALFDRLPEPGSFPIPGPNPSPPTDPSNPLGNKADMRTRTILIPITVASQAAQRPKGTQ